MEAKHTPGPWEVNGDRDEADGLTVEARGGEVCFIASTTGYAKADIANAFLIAAAPELLEACEAAVDELIGLRSYLTTCDFGVIRENIDGLAIKMKIVQEKIEAVIRKAKGE